MARILVIDDEASWLEVCREKLIELGHEVKTTGCCSDALQIIKEASPDAVVLDLRMPVSGRAMLQAMRQDWPDIPVVVHTHYSGYRDDPDLARTAGFAVKSPDLAELAETVGRVLAVREFASKRRRET